MHPIAYMLIEAAAVAAAVSVDAFAAGFSYGANRIKLPLSSVLIITAICSAMLGAAMFAGSWVGKYISQTATSYIGFGILLTLGTIKLLDCAVKIFIRRRARRNPEIKFSAFNVRFILTLYADPELADTDSSGSISPAEAVSLSVVLSFDGIAVGLGAAMGGVDPLAAVTATAAFTAAAVALGRFLGNKTAQRLGSGISWLGGVVLIVLAVTKLP